MVLAMRSTVAADTALCIPDMHRRNDKKPLAEGGRHKYSRRFHATDGLRLRLHRGLVEALRKGTG